MNRYKVVLTFNHPGEGEAVEDHSTTNSPDKWNWQKVIDVPEITNLNVEVYEQAEWTRIK